MRVIDVHTHMVGRDWLALLTEYGGAYRLGDSVDGTTIYRGDVSVLTLTDAMFDYDGRVAAMDAAGVDTALVSLTCPNVYWGDERVSTDAARVVNDEFAAQRWARPERIGFLASLPWQYPDRAVAELARAHDLGAAGVMVLANIEGEPLTSPLFAPVWRAIDDRALPVLVHPTVPAGAEQLDIGKYQMVWSVGFTFDTTLALTRMILSGFLDTYPNLKIIGAHAGGTLPYLMGRLDLGFHAYKEEREVITEPPSSYARRLYCDAISYSPASLALAIDVFGADHVMFGSDFPHLCSRMAETLAMVDKLPGGQPEMIRGGNARRLFFAGS